MRCYMQSIQLGAWHRVGAQKKKILFLLMIEFLVVRNTVLFISLVSTPFSAKPGTKKDNKYMISECVHDLNID